MEIIAILLASLIPRTPLLTDSVDVIEVNHTYSTATNGLVLSQVIAWNWSTGDRRYRIVAWRLITNKNWKPVRRARNGFYETIAADKGYLRKITSRSVVETWTDYDPEMIRRNDWPQDMRKGFETRPRSRFWRSHEPDLSPPIIDIGQ